MKPERAPLPVLIARLARDGEPVTPLPSPLVRWGVWTLTATVAAAIVTMAIGVRPDLAVLMRDARLTLAAMLTGSLALTAACTAFMLSVPGAARSRAARVVPLIVLVAWGVLLWARLIAIGNPLVAIATTPRHPACVLVIVTISALPAIWLFAMLRRAAPLDAQATGLFAALAALACGALGTQFVCRIDAPGHQLLWHVVPVVVLALVGLALGPLLSRWRPSLKRVPARPLRDVG